MIVEMIGMGASAVALWGVGRRQQIVAPVSVRLGRWAVVAHLVVQVLLVAISVTMPFVSRCMEHAVDLSRVFWATGIPFTLALACLGWASRSNNDMWQRWASSGLLTVAALGVFEVSWSLVAIRPRGLWLRWLRAALTFAMWTAVGLWLRRGRSPATRAMEFAGRP
jgi:hypothetical protein